MAKRVFFAHTSIFQADSVLGGTQWTLQSQVWSVDDESQVLSSIKGLALENIAGHQATCKDLDAELPTFFEDVGKAMAAYIERKQEEDKAKDGDKDAPVAETHPTEESTGHALLEEPASAALPSIPVKSMVSHFRVQQMGYQFPLPPCRERAREASPVLSSLQPVQ